MEILERNVPANLTKPYIDNLKPKKTKYSITDTKVPGMLIEVYPSGMKTFYLKWQSNGRAKFLRLGKFGYDITLEQARKMAQEYRGEVVKGVDLVEQRKSQKNAMTFEEAMTLYMEAMSEGPNPQFKSTTKKTCEGYLKTHIIPALGPKRLRTIKPEDVYKLHAKLGKIKQTADRIVGFLSSFSNWCIAMGFLPETSHLTRKIKKYNVPARSFSMAPKDRNIFYKTLNQLIQSNKGHYFALQAIKLMYLTGARRNEILTLQISHIDTKKMILGLTQSKTGRGMVATRSIAVVVPSEVFPVLDEIRSRNDSPVLGYVFPWKTIDAAHTANDRAWKVLKAEYVKALDKAGIKPRFELRKNHDLRHSFASTSIELGNQIPMLSIVLGHASLGYTTQRYVHMTNEVAQDLMMKKMDKSYVE